MVDYEKRLRGTKKDISFHDIQPIIDDYKVKISEKIHMSPSAKTPDEKANPSETQIRRQYAYELEVQMLEKKAKDLAEKKSNKLPGISKDFHGYPHMPKASQEEILSIKLMQKQELKKALDSQIRRKAVRKDMEKLQEIEFDKQFNNYAKESLLKEKTLAKLNRIKHSEILNRTWSQAAKLKEYKELEENILRKGCTQALIKTFIKQTQETELPAIVKDIKTQIHADLIKDSPKIIEKHEVSKEKLVLNIEKLKDANKSALGEDLKHREEKKIIVKNYSCMTDYGVLRVLRFPPYPKPKPKLKLKHK